LTQILGTKTQGYFMYMLVLIHSFIYSFIYAVFTGLSKRRRVRWKIVAIRNGETRLDGKGCADLSSYRWEGTSNM